MGYFLYMHWLHWSSHMAEIEWLFVVYYYYYFLSILFISKSMDLWKITCISYTCVINCYFHLFDLQLPSLASNIFYFSNHQGTIMFLFFLLFSLMPSVLQWHHEEGNFFSEFDQPNRFFYAGYYLEAFSFPLYVQELHH